MVELTNCLAGNYFCWKKGPSRLFQLAHEFYTKDSSHPGEDSCC